MPTPVPTTLLLAPAGVDPAPVAEALRRAGGEGVAVLSPDAGPAGLRPLPLACPCCVGSVAFRVALVETLRRARPRRLVIVAPPGAHPDGTIRALGEEAAAGLLAPGPALLVLPGALPLPAAARALLPFAGRIVVTSGDAAAVEAAAGLPAVAVDRILAEGLTETT